MRASPVWVKGDMVYAVSFTRLDLVRFGKHHDGKRIYDYTPLDAETMRVVDGCVLCGMGLDYLTKHLV